MATDLPRPGGALTDTPCLPADKPQVANSPQNSEVRGGGTALFVDAARCSACPVEKGQCPRCPTYWIVRADGKKFGFLGLPTGVVTLIEVGAPDGLTTKADCEELQAFVDRVREVVNAA